MEIEFGLKTNNELPDLDTGSTNTTTSSSNVAVADVKGTKQTKEEAMAIVERDRANNVSFSAPTDSPSQNTPPVTVSNSVSTDELEGYSQAQNAVIPTRAEPERIEVQVAEPTEQQLELERRQKEDERLRNDVFEGLEGLADRGEFQSDLEEETGLQKKKEAKTAIDNKIMKKQREFDLALRDAQDTFGTRAQKSAIKAEISKDYNRRLADLSIQQMALAGEYNDAKSYVDKKVELEFQDRRAELDALSFLYTENKDRLTTVEQREFNKKIQTEERAYQKEFAKTQQLEDMKLTMVINATEAGAGSATLDAIQNAKDINGLLSLPNAGTYTKSKADRLAEQLAGINVSKAQKELDILNNPPADTSGLTPALQKTITGLSAGERTNLVDANDTVRSMERLKELISGNNYADLATVATEAGREFNRLSLDVADKMARERTGAVVNPEEMKTFKKVLGLTLFNRTISDKDEVLSTLDRQLTKHGEAQNLVDPSGEIRGFLNQNAGGEVQVSTSDYLNQVDSTLSNPYGAYITDNN